MHPGVFWQSLDFYALPLQLNGQPVGQPVPVGPDGRFTTQITAPSADGQYPLRIDYIPPGATTPGASTTDTLNVGTGSGVGPNGFTIALGDGSSGELLLHVWPCPTADSIRHYAGMLRSLISLQLLEKVCKPYGQGIRPLLDICCCRHALLSHLMAACFAVQASLSPIAWDPRQ